MDGVRYGKDADRKCSGPRYLLFRPEGHVSRRVTVITVCGTEGTGYWDFSRRGWEMLSGKERQAR
jgi:hypothetical protein